MARFSPFPQALLKQVLEVAGIKYAYFTTRSDALPLFSHREANMSATIKIFHVGQRCFSHVLNTHHDSVELHDEFNEILLVYGADARVRDQRGRMGNFEAEYVDGQPHWVYYESCERHDESAPCEQTRIVYGPDLPTAEVELSKRYISMADPVDDDER